MQFVSEAVPELGPMTADVRLVPWVRRTAVYTTVVGMHPEFNWGCDRQVPTGRARKAGA